MNYNPQRTFIHEVGHFVARELNLYLYNIGYGVEKMYITGKENIYDINKGSGGTIPKKDSKFLEDNIVHNPPQLIAVLIYGCLFQTLYQKSDFNNCFSIASSANGKKDAEHFTSLEKYINGPKRKRVIEYVNEKYIHSLSSDFHHFEIINNLHFLDFVEYTIEGDYIIILDKLRDYLNIFFEKHSIHYKELISFITEIINS